MLAVSVIASMLTATAALTVAPPTIAGPWSVELEQVPSGIVEFVVSLTYTR